MRIEVFHPERQMIQLHTDDPLRLITALRTWVSIAYLGTPPAFVGIRMRIPPELAPPLPPIKVRPFPVLHSCTHKCHFVRGLVL